MYPLCPVTASSIQSQAGKCPSAGRTAYGLKGLERQLQGITGLEVLCRALSPFSTSFRVGSHQSLEETRQGRPGDPA